MRTLFPFHYEMLFIMVLATCSKYSDVRANFLSRQEQKRDRINQSVLSDTARAYSEAIHEDGFSSATESDAGLGHEDATVTPTTEGQESTPEVTDETLRGRFYHFF